jgi:TonB family protein
VNNDWLDIELLEHYLDGKLDSKAMHRIEKQALEDPFVAQALAGLTASPKRASQNVSLLQKQLYERIGQQQVTKKTSVYTWQRLSIAAAAAVMFISVSIIFFIREEEHRTELAKIKNCPKNIEVNIAPSTAAIDSSGEQTYAANKVTKKANSPVDAGMISPRRKMENRPVQTTADLNSKIDPSTTDTAVAAPRTAAISARIASVLPSVSAPVGGWANLDIYIAEHNKLSRENSSGKFVELSFLVDSEGNPSDIKVEKSATREFDDEALRLIKEGPKWEQPKTAGARVNYTITF